MMTHSTNIQRAATALFAIGFALLPLIWPGLNGTSSDLLPKRAFLCAFSGIAALLCLRQTRTSPLFLPATLYLLWNILSLIWAGNPFTGWIEALQLSALLVLFFAFVQCFDIRQARLLCQGITCGGLAVALIGIAQYLGLGFERIPSVGLPSSTFVFRNLAASYLIAAIPIGALAALLETRAPRRLFFAFATALMILFLIYTRTRATWVGLAGALILALFCLAIFQNLRLSLRENWRKSPPVFRWGIAACAALIIAGTFAPARTSPAVIQQFDELKSSALTAATSLAAPGSDRGRLNIWRNTLRLIADHPLIGVGLDNWEYAFPPYDRGQVFTFHTEFTRPHNDFLWIASELGLIGLALYLYLLFVAARVLYHHLHTGTGQTPIIALGAGIGLIALLGESLFAFPKEQPASAAFFWLHLAILGSLSARPRTPHPVFARIAPILGILIAIAGCYTTYRHMAFERHFARAQTLEKAGHWPQVYREAEQALSFGPFDHRALFLKARALQRTGQSDQAERAYRDALRAHPNYAHTHHNMAGLYADKKDWPRALSAYERALFIRPNYVQARINLGSALFATGDLDGAQRAFEIAIRDAPKMPEAHANLGAIYLHQHQFDQAIAALEQAIALRPAYPEALNNLAYAYEQQGRIREAIAAYEKLLQHWQGDPAYRQIIQDHLIGLKDRER